MPKRGGDGSPGRRLQLSHRGSSILSTSLQVAFGKFVSVRFGAEAWSKLLHDSALNASMDLASAGNRGDALALLLMATARVTSEQSAAVLEELGAFLAGQLLSRYRERIDPAWTTIDLVAFASRALALWFARNETAHLPAMRCIRTGERAMRIVYASRRRLCPLIRGLIFGAAQRRGETLVWTEERCLLKGASFCEILVELQGRAPAA
ncbi:hypothetical protein EPN52_03495 [bacterium]|nr:MAG: hypothetical protein EPN52_03495 [bacterium]